MRYNFYPDIRETISTRIHEKQFLPVYMRNNFYPDTCETISTRIYVKKVSTQLYGTKTPVSLFNSRRKIHASEKWNGWIVGRKWHLSRKIVMVKKNSSDSSFILHPMRTGRIDIFFFLFFFLVSLAPVARRPIIIIIIVHLIEDAADLAITNLARTSLTKNTIRVRDFFFFLSQTSAPPDISVLLITRRYRFVSPRTIRLRKLRARRGGKGSRREWSIG